MSKEENERRGENQGPTMDCEFYHKCGGKPLESLNWKVTWPNQPLKWYFWLIFFHFLNAEVPPRLYPILFSIYTFIIELNIEFQLYRLVVPKSTSLISRHGLVSISSWMLTGVSNNINLIWPLISLSSLPLPQSLPPQCTPLQKKKNCLSICSHR